jgi:hypothetical protein
VSVKTSATGISAIAIMIMITITINNSNKMTCFQMHNNVKFVTSYW